MCMCSDQPLPEQHQWMFLSRHWPVPFVLRLQALHQVFGFHRHHLHLPQQPLLRLCPWCLRVWGFSSVRVGDCAILSRLWLSRYVTAPFSPEFSSEGSDCPIVSRLELRVGGDCAILSRLELRVGSDCPIVSRLELRAGGDCAILSRLELRVGSDCPIVSRLELRAGGDCAILSRLELSAGRWLPHCL